MKVVGLPTTCEHMFRKACKCAAGYIALAVFVLAVGLSQGPAARVRWGQSQALVLWQPKLIPWRTSCSWWKQKEGGACCEQPLHEADIMFIAACASAPQTTMFTISMFSAEGVDSLLLAAV